MPTVVTHSASTALPYPHLERATARLRAQLRFRLAEHDIDWTTLTVTGMGTSLDARGLRVVRVRATVTTRDAAATSDEPDPKR